MSEPAKVVRSVDGLLLLLSLIVALLAISGGSLWIDEGNAAYKAMQPTIDEFAHALVTEGGSDAQMPLYMLYLWEWEKLFGHGEWVLRMANLPLWLLAHGALLAAARRLGPVAARVARTTVFLACLSPFLWAYLDEARPYIMLYAGGMVLFAFLLELSGDATRILRLATVWKGSAAVLLLAGGSLLGVPWVAVGGLIALWLIWRGRGAFQGQRPKIDKAAVVLAGVAGVGLGALGLYYLSTMTAGGGASRQGNGVGNLAFLVYEMSGFLGLGPGRIILRGDGVGEAMKGFLPLLALGAVGMMLPLAVGLWQVLRGKWRDLHEAFPAWMLLFALPLGLTMGAGVSSGVRLLGRHFMPGTVLLLWAIAVLLVALRLPGRAGRPAPLWLTVTLPVVWLFSCTQLRWGSQPQRDNYRTAARAAVEVLEAGGRVIWSADHPTAIYYGLPRSESEEFQIVINPESDPFVTQPDLLVCSRPDIYDAYGKTREGAVANGYEVALAPVSFTLYRRPAQRQ